MKFRSTLKENKMQVTYHSSKLGKEGKGKGITTAKDIKKSQCGSLKRYVSTSLSWS
jgi:hypothetical protein